MRQPTEEEAACRVECESLAQAPAILAHRSQIHAVHRCPTLHSQGQLDGGIRGTSECALELACKRHWLYGTSSTVDLLQSQCELLAQKTMQKQQQQVRLQRGESAAPKGTQAVPWWHSTWLLAASLVTQLATPHINGCARHPAVFPTLMLSYAQQQATSCTLVAHPASCPFLLASLFPDCLSPFSIKLSRKLLEGCSQVLLRLDRLKTQSSSSSSWTGRPEDARGARQVAAVTAWRCNAPSACSSHAAQPNRTRAPHGRNSRPGDWRASPQSRWV